MFRRVMLARPAVIVASSLGLAVGILASIVLGANALQGDDKLPPLSAAEVPTPVFSRWVNPDGEFVGYIWDNRHLGSSQKAAKPWYDPRWKPFSACMGDRGHEVRDDPSSVPFGQEHLDEIVARANAERPNGAGTLRAIGDGEDLGGIAQAYIDCANRWLTIEYEQLAANGIEWIEPGEIPEP